MFKGDYEALQARLSTLPDQLTHDVMVGDDACEVWLLCATSNDAPNAGLQTSGSNM